VPVEDRKKLESHFSFGKNWASYAGLIGEPQIEEATKGLLKLIPAEDFAGRSFLDIGCGSGLHALAAGRLGVSRVVAVDIDPVSVATAKTVLSANDFKPPWQAEVKSVFDLNPETDGTFDIVYSWGVLHHTGDLWQAVAKAASMVSVNGLLVLALYRRTYLDPFWLVEKRLYAHAPRPIQSLVRGIYVAMFRLGMLATGRSFRDYVAKYKSYRGMDFYHDIHDWLGGHPYEMTLAPEVDVRLTALGFAAERVFARPKGSGILGSGCDEYVYRRHE
jgi:2-polyprenyl-6-hydroxyphenyl methylase/3-demethylubiquinone-9 3-methyltransferase